MLICQVEVEVEVEVGHLFLVEVLVGGGGS